QALQRLQQLQAATGMQVIALDYCPGADKTCRRELAQRLDDHGVQPYVTAPGVGIVGIGRLEVMPRKILVVQAPGRDVPLESTVGGLAVAMPLNYLGYDVRFLDLGTQPLP